MRTVVSINSGTGPVLEATAEEASKNMKAFANDLAGRGVAIKAISRRKKLDYGEGRFAFNLKVCYKKLKRDIEVQMPGLPLEKVRYTGEQDIWLFPRLYIDGSSWVWKYAVNVSVPEKNED